MAFPRKYPPDFVDDVVQRVAAARAAGHHGAITAVARDVNLDRRLVQKWVSRATAPPDPTHAVTSHQPGWPEGNGSDRWLAHLPPGLLHCRFCRHPMTALEPDTPARTYQCPPGCRPQPVDAATLTDTIGRAMLRHAAHILPATGAPTRAHLAAVHAHRVLARVTIGTTATDITLTWRPTPTPPPDQLHANRPRRVTAARELAHSDPLRARQLLHDSLTGIDPTTTPADPHLADAAALLAHLNLRLRQPSAAITWARYAHHSAVHLHGPTHRRTLDTLHLLADAHYHTGHHQRAHQLYRQLADHLASTDGPHAHRTLATHATTALVLHALGHCQAARTLLADTITTHRREHPGHPATARMTQHLTRLWNDCATKGHQHHDAC